jgi:hypothetical protein
MVVKEIDDTLSQEERFERFDKANPKAYQYARLYAI